MNRLLRRLAFVLLIALGLACAAPVLVLWSSLPKTEGRLELAGLDAPVAVVRDRFGIPHIEASSERDAYLALGFVHAQDRLWQMDFQRRLGAGRLAEVVGESGLSFDRLTRTLGLYRNAEASLAALDPGARGLFEAYTAGVNAFLENRSGFLPPEFLLLGYEPEAWSVPDSLVVTRVMALGLAENWRRELLRARLRQEVGQDEFRDLFPETPPEGPITLAALGGEQLERLAAVLPPAPPRGQGSNAWVLSGARTESGAPLLANDPHLSQRAPGVWYLAHLKVPGLNVIGATLPGLPVVVLGRNDRIAWGFTNTGGDAQDLFIERIADDPGRYVTPSGSEPFQVREERLRVGERVEILRVRETRHGPVLSDALGPAAPVSPDQAVMSIAWTLLRSDDVTPQAGFAIARAQDWDSFVEALRDFTSPQQNVHYADTSGHIGFMAPGRLPVRRAGDGLEPVDGALGAYDWTGTIPFEALPRALDPAEGRLLNANNRIVGDGYPFLITRDWEPDDRARRIDAALAGGGFDLDDMRRLQQDRVSMLARDLLPVMLGPMGRDAPAQDLLARLQTWDGEASGDRIEPLLFHAWYRALSERLYADELGPLFTDFRGMRSRFVSSALTGRTRHAWCDDGRTPERETCAPILKAAWADGLEELKALFGEDPDLWRWGRAHRLCYEHPILSRVPILGGYTTLCREMGGDGTSVDVAHVDYDDPTDPYAVAIGATFRGLYDLGAPEQSRFVASFGQSGHPLSAHYRDMTAIWAADGDLPMTTEPGRYKDGRERVLLLEPEDS